MPGSSASASVYIAMRMLKSAMIEASSGVAVRTETLVVVIAHA